MNFLSDKEIEYIALSVRDLTLPKSEWTHAAHFAAALWLLTNPDYDAFMDMPDMIRRYNEATGVPNNEIRGYHETITMASLKIAKSFLNTAPAGTQLFEILNKIMASKFGKSSWMLDYWNRDSLFTPKARQEWVEPDLAQFPF